MTKTAGLQTHASTVCAQGGTKKTCTNLSFFSTCITYTETLSAKKVSSTKTGILYGMTILPMLVANYSYSHCAEPSPSKPACQEPAALLFTAKQIDTKTQPSERISPWRRTRACLRATSSPCRPALGTRLGQGAPRVRTLAVSSKPGTARETNC